jgi:hypothetical protein
MAYENWSMGASVILLFGGSWGNMASLSVKSIEMVL